MHEIYYTSQTKKNQKRQIKRKEKETKTQDEIKELTGGVSLSVCQMYPQQVHQPFLCQSLHLDPQDRSSTSQGSPSHMTVCSLCLELCLIDYQSRELTIHHVIQIEWYAPSKCNNPMDNENLWTCWKFSSLVKALSISSSWFACAVVGEIVGDWGVALPDTRFGVPCELSMPSVDISLTRRNKSEAMVLCIPRIGLYYG